MRTYRIRTDLFICLIVAGLIFVGGYQLLKKTGAGDAIFSAAESKMEQKYASDPVEDGKIGGKAAEGTQEVNSIAEMLYAQEPFTVRVSTFHYAGMPTVRGGNHSYLVLKLEDGNILTKLNYDSRVKVTAGDEEVYILPVGEIKKEKPDEEAVKMAHDLGMDVLSDCYLDMDGGASKDDAAFNQVFSLIGVLPFVIFAGFMVLVFLLHAIGAKIGIFPPLFVKKKEN